MKFRLTYEGRLEANGSPKHKHEIRKAFHKQLKRLWAVEPNLAAWKYPQSALMPEEWESVLSAAEQSDKHEAQMWELHSVRYRRGNYRYVPLATKSLSLIAGLEILFLRVSEPGGIIRSGDIDNRLKTLFDALKMPRQDGELGGYLDPGDGEDPFFVLLEDDGLINHVSVEADMLLEPTCSAKGAVLANDARLIISVHIRPTLMGLGNIHFG